MSEKDEIAVSEVGNYTVQIKASNGTHLIAELRRAHAEHHC